MSALELFKQSNAWDERYGLPLCPSLNNPWLYGAYALKLMRERGLTAIEELKLVERFREHAYSCRVEPGLFNRWPDGSGGFTSHDELMGMAYISSELAHEILTYLEATDGVYVNKEQDKIDFKDDWQYRFNVYRMIWFKPFLKARAGSNLNLFSQFLFAGHLLLDAWRIKDEQEAIFDQGGRLRIWIMLEAMETFAITGAAVSVWREKMNRIKASPKGMLTFEPKECPIYRSLGAEKF